MYCADCVLNEYSPSHVLAVIHFAYFTVSNGVKPGEYISSVLCNIFIDELNINSNSLSNGNADDL